MKILTDAQAYTVLGLLLEVEKASSKAEQVQNAEKIRGIILQAEQITVKFEQ